MSRESERHVHAVTAALQILGAFDRDSPLRLKDLHARTGLNRSRILRFAGTLAASGYLEYDEATGSFSLGPAVYALGSLVQERYRQLSHVVRPSLRRLVERSGDTAFYSIVQGSERLVVAREESTEGLRFIVNEGQVRPLHAGASSKVLLAFGPEALRRRVLEDPQLERLTLATRTDPGALAQEVAQVARDGFAVSRGEATAHGFAVSVPVLRGGQTYDALTIAGPLTKLTDELAKCYIADLGEEARIISATFEHAAAARGDVAVA